MWNKEHGPKEHVDDTSELRENEECKHNSRDGNIVVAATGEGRACMPRGSHDPASGEQPRANNSAGGVSGTPATTPPCY
jgi:hypothetical protein